MRADPRSLPAFLLAIIASLVFCAAALAETDPLPSWNNGPTKQAILGFVQQATDTAGPGFVPLADRIATFSQSLMDEAHK
jgi:hypothetical protein